MQSLSLFLPPSPILFPCSLPRPLSLTLACFFPVTGLRVYPTDYAVWCGTCTRPQSDGGGPLPLVLSSYPPSDSHSTLSVRRFCGLWRCNSVVRLLRKERERAPPCYGGARTDGRPHSLVCCSQCCVCSFKLGLKATEKAERRLEKEGTRTKEEGGRRLQEVQRCRKEEEGGQWREARKGHVGNYNYPRRKKEEGAA